MLETTGIILAGGKSTRMGTNKALLPLGRQSLLAKIVVTLKPLFKELIVVTNNPELYPDVDARLVKDLIPGHGPLSGIHAGLTSASRKYSFVVPCDMPFLDSDLIRYLISQAPGYDVVVPFRGEYLQPLHAVYSRDCLPAIEACLEEGEYQAFAFYSRVNVRYIDLYELDGIADIEQVFFNINTPADIDVAHRLMEKGARSFLPLEKAREALLTGLEPCGRVEEKIETSAGRVLAMPLTASEPFPPFPRSLVDGYALGPSPGENAAGTQEGRYYRLLGTITAGSSEEITLEPGTSAEIMTGARIPAGTVAVVPREQVSVRENDIVVTVLPQPPGKFIEPAGSQVTAGEQVLKEGAKINAAEVGLLAAIGRHEVIVYRRPRVVLAASGSELEELSGGGVAESHIYNSNFYTLKAAIEVDGGEVVPLGVLEDNLTRQAIAYREALKEGDLLITTGGTGFSESDLTAEAFKRAGGEIIFNGLKIHPGRQTLAARSENKLMLGLPGSPPAALLAYYLLAAPVIRYLGGRDPLPAILTARLVKPVDKQRPVRSFIWARLRVAGDDVQVEPLPRGRGGVRAAVGANALIDLPPGAGLTAGETVRVLLLGTIF